MHVCGANDMLVQYYGDHGCFPLLQGFLNIETGSSLSLPRCASNTVEGGAIQEKNMCYRKVRGLRIDPMLSALGNGRRSAFSLDGERIP